MRITNPRILAAGASLVPNRAMYSPEIWKKYLLCKWKLNQICTANFYPITQQVQTSNWVEDKLEGPLSEVWGIETIIFFGVVKSCFLAKNFPM